MISHHDKNGCVSLHRQTSMEAKELCPEKQLSLVASSYCWLEETEETVMEHGRLVWL